MPVAARSCDALHTRRRILLLNPHAEEDGLPMDIHGRHYRTIWPIAASDSPSGRAAVGIIDQTRLPFEFEELVLTDLEGAAQAIATMQVRGAPLIGAATAYGIALHLSSGGDASDAGLAKACEILHATRPTASNLAWALTRMRAALEPLPEGERAAAAFAEAATICDEDVATNRAIGDHGLKILREAHERAPGRPLNVLTHCNAGWLATVDWGTATAPIYRAHDAGIPLHVWVDETRPRNQGASLTAYELHHHGVPHTVVVDSAAGHLMQHGQVDLCIVGTDRTTASGDVCNKIGTYLKALAARDNSVPFYVALPSSTIDWDIRDGVAEVPIEQRPPEEVTHMRGRRGNGMVETMRIVSEGSSAANYAFDVTPARLVNALITERGICEASEQGLRALYSHPQSAAGAQLAAGASSASG